MSIVSPTHLSDRHLHSSVKKARQTEHVALFDVLAHLGEIDRRRTYRDLGYSSIFRYCTEELGYSSSAAGRRIQTARCIRRFPEIGPLLRHHEVNLTTVDQVAKILNEANKERVIQQIRYKSEREVQAIVARYRPPVELGDRVKTVVVRVPVTEQSVRQNTSPRACENRSRSGTARSGDAGTGVLEPCEKDNYSRSGSSGESQIASTDSLPKTQIARRIHIQFLAEPEFMTKYEEAKGILSNKHPNASFATVFNAVLDDFLERRCPRRREQRRKLRNATVRRTRPVKIRRTVARANAKLSTRHIPAAVRDRVFKRDGGRCTYVSSNGRRCTQTRNLHIDHVTPFAMGGTNAASNLRVLCRAHNQLVAEQSFGARHMQQFRRTV